MIAPGTGTSTVMSDDEAPAPPFDELRSHARTLVFPGFLTRAEVVEAMLEYFDLTGPDDERRVVPVVEEAWRAREAELRAAEASATGPDDHARFEAAVADLARDTILVRPDFTCCSTCGHDEIGDERGPERRERGYAFFHRQDTERIPDGTLFLAFGAFGPWPEVDPGILARAYAEADTPDRAAARREAMDASTTMTGQLVAGTLRRHGLDVAWSGSGEERVLVHLRDWRRPLPADPEVDGEPGGKPGGDTDGRRGLLGRVVRRGSR